ncbi:hypothetical protein PIIN_11669 [Serendipita indica DSM 11827]|uniref:Uncharacterized protein n=1 Tax=Serendipita indica (strain DSM 11827) TaxID=1109443 RepID=G4U298_SERID|nr:hypothetical protein PIIN_11669 [Serendipita indica DSM 11827]
MEICINGEPKLPNVRWFLTIPQQNNIPYMKESDNYDVPSLIYMITSIERYGITVKVQEADLSTKEKQETWLSSALGMGEELP